MFRLRMVVIIGSLLASMVGGSLLLDRGRALWEGYKTNIQHQKKLEWTIDNANHEREVLKSQNELLQETNSELQKVNDWAYYQMDKDKLIKQQLREENAELQKILDSRIPAILGP